MASVYSFSEAQRHRHSLQQWLTNTVKQHVSREPWAEGHSSGETWTQGAIQHQGTGVGHGTPSPEDTFNGRNTLALAIGRGRCAQLCLRIRRALVGKNPGVITGGLTAMTTCTRTTGLPSAVSACDKSGRFHEVKIGTLCSRATVSCPRRSAGIVNPPQRAVQAQRIRKNYHVRRSRERSQ
jgi:hypothetical protein